MLASGPLSRYGIRMAQPVLKKIEIEPELLEQAARLGIDVTGVDERNLRLYLQKVDPPSFQWTPMLAFRSWRGVSDECSTPGVSGIVQA